MSDFVLTLNGIEFAGFEVPDGIAGGGGQLIKPHRYAGGQRTIDAFGPDDAPLRWTGTLLGPNAEPRCQELDAMRKSGKAVEASWASFSYLVVISEFTWTFKKFWHIEYSLALEVVEDHAQGLAKEGLDPESVLQQDLDTSADYTEVIDDTGLTSLTAVMLASAASVPSIMAAPASFLAGFGTNIGGALDYTLGLVGGADLGLESFPEMLAGGDPQQMAADLEAMSADSATVANGFVMQNTLGRLQRNVQAITG